jgi:hypothetical protein
MKQTNTKSMNGKRVDYFKVEFNGGIYIIHNDHKKDFLEFLDYHQTALPYMAKHYTIQELSDFLRGKTQ